MIKKIPILIMFVGILFIGYSLSQILATIEAQNNSMKQAISLVRSTDEKAAPIKNEAYTESSTFKPDMGSTVGILTIPRLRAELPIVEGTDEDELAKGVGHYKGSSYPRQQNQIILSGHRDTVFRSLGELKKGDTLIMEMPYGQFSYKIDSTYIVEADDTTVIRDTAPEEILTLTTCYPFSYVGNAPQRYIIEASPLTE